MKYVLQLLKIKLVDQICFRIEFSMTPPQNSPSYSLPFSNDLTIRELCHMPHITTPFSSSFSISIGFRRGLSCGTQLITVIIIRLGISANVHGQVDAVCLHFAKAFDTVPHEQLLIKADFYGIRNKANIWLRSFLTGRSQRVVVNGSASSWSLQCSFRGASGNRLESHPSFYVY